MFDCNDLLNAAESRAVTMPDGRVQQVTMSRAGWTSFDDLCDDEFFCAQDLMEYALWYCDCSPEKRKGRNFGGWLELAMMKVQERLRQNEQSLAAFHRFCVRQPSDDEGLRRIDEEARRIRDQRAADRPD